MLLTEIFDQPAAWKILYQSDTELEVTFGIKDMRYVVRILAEIDENDNIEIPSTWSVEFVTLNPDDELGEDGNADITGTGNQHIVFSTLVNILQNFIKQYNPDIVNFGAREANRFKLYQHLIKRVVPTWKSTTSGIAGGHWVTITNPRGRAV
jgi:hypothetical protein